MKHLLLTIALLLILSLSAHSKEKYNSLIIYEIPIYLKNRAETFINKINSDEKTLFKTLDNKYIIIAKSKGFGIEQYEYLLINKFNKKIINYGSHEYFRWKQRLIQSR